MAKETKESRELSVLSDTAKSRDLAAQEKSKAMMDGYSDSLLESRQEAIKKITAMPTPYERAKKLMPSLTVKYPVGWSRLEMGKPPPIDRSYLREQVRSAGLDSPRLEAFMQKANRGSGIVPGARFSSSEDLVKKATTGLYRRGSDRAQAGVSSFGRSDPQSLRKRLPGSSVPRPPRVI